MLFTIASLQYVRTEKITYLCLVLFIFGSIYFLYVTKEGTLSVIVVFLKI